MSGLELVTRSSILASDPTALITVNCPAGKLAIGGGASIVGGSTSVALFHNQPALNLAGSPIGWVGGGFEVTAYAPNWGVSAYAICATVAP